MRLTLFFRYISAGMGVRRSFLLAFNTSIDDAIFWAFVVCTSAALYFGPLF